LPLPAGRCASKLAGVEHTQLSQYLGVLMALVLALAMAGGMVGLSTLLGRRGRTSPAKDSAYECGMIAVGPGTVRYSVKFYLVAMLFVLFDVETVFLYPWAVVYGELLREPGLGDVILGGTLTFLGVLAIGYLYALKKGAFDWKT
jgi:NADH-quinone oxidoreductase subunit A